MQTQSADYFTGIRDNLTALALDWGRSKLIDVERPSDTRSVNDVVDVREGQATGTGGVGTMLLVAVAVVGGVLLLKRAL